MSDCDTNSEDSKDSSATAVPQFLAVNNINNIPIVNGNHVIFAEYVDSEEAKPFIEVVEQPQSRGFRFRYECEGPSHGGLQGEKSEKYRKTYPAIRIRNYNGPSRVVVTLVTEEPVPRPHAHKLVGKNCTDGSCVVEVKQGQSTVTFANLCVQHVTRKKSAEVIEHRILEAMKLDKLVKQGNLNIEAFLSEEEKERAKQQAEKQAKDMQLNVVRLCFQAYLRDEQGQFTRLLPSVLSSPIYDSKAPGANVLKICRMDKYGGSCKGDEEVFLLCEKVQKDDISVRFVEQDEDGNVVWEAFGNFGPFDVHRQYAIVFKTPPYKDPSIDRTVNVLIMLQRKSDGETSDPKSFTYYPQKDEIDELLKHKRSKKMPNYPGPGNFGPGSGGDQGRRSLQIGNGLQPNSPFGQASPGNLPITVNQDHMDTTPISCPPQPPQQTQQISRPMAQPKRGRPPKQTITSTITSNNDLMTDGEGQIPLFDMYMAGMAPQNPWMRPPQDNKQQMFMNPNIPYPQFTTSNPHIPLQQVQPRGPSLTPRGTVIRTAPGINGDLRRGFDEIDSAPFKPMEACFPPDHGFIKSSSDSNICGKFSHYGNDEFSRIMPLECNVVPASEKSKGIIEDLGIDMFQNDDENDIETEKSEQENKSISEDVDMKTNNQNRHSMEQEINKEETERVLGQFQECSAQTENNSEVMHIVDRTSKALQFYAATGNIKQLLFVQRHLMSLSDDSGDLPLHTAIINNQLEVIHNLLDVMSTLPYCRHKVSAYNSLRQTPLHLAVLMNQPGVLDRLLNVGADPKMVDRKGNTPAHLAVLYGANSCLSVLVKYQRPNTAKNKPFPELDIKNFDGFSPAHLAALTQNCNAMKLLARGKANMNLPDGKSGRSPLHHAVERDDLSTIGFLILEAKANVNAPCFDGNTPLHIACARQNVGVVALLMTAGADPDMENDEVKEELYDEFEGIPEDKQTDENSFHLDCYKPEDFAMDNEKVIRVLRGEPYTNVKEYDDVEPDYKHTTEYFASLSIQDVNIVKEETSQDGDVQNLLYPVRVQMSKMLDPPNEGKDWIALANALGLYELMEGHNSGYSQTRLLLNYYEECGGTISFLIDCLRSINRTDVASLISQYHSSGTSKQSNTNANCYDSGMGSGEVKPLQTLTAAM